MMTLHKLASIEELEECVRIHQGNLDESFLPMDHAAEVIQQQERLTQGCWMRVLKRDGEIVAWVIARLGRSELNGKKVMTQATCASALKGVAAVRAIVILHEALVAEAKRRGATLVVSTGGFMDDSFQFARILEKQGWRRRGSWAVYPIET